MDLINILALPINDDVLTKIGFSDYDDEHCTWGNRRLFIGGEMFKGKFVDSWYKLQIIEYCDFPGENDPEFNDCFWYAGWFELIPSFRTENSWRLNTVKDIYKIIYLYHPEWLSNFKEILIKSWKTAK